MNTEVSVAEVSLWLLVITMVKVTVLPAEMEAAAKLLDMLGAERLTGSVSLEEHTPLIQVVAVFVLLTVAGGVITAVLVTAVWANAAGSVNAENTKASATKVEAR